MWRHVSNAVSLNTDTLLNEPQNVISNNVVDSGEHVQPPIKLRNSK